METSIIQPIANSPSLIRQIVDEVDTLDDQGKTEILRKIKLQKALMLAATADEQLQGKFKEMSEEEIANMVSENRKNWYEAAPSY
jgi:type II secretory pathway component GspD/PulD (secretin)